MPRYHCTVLSSKYKSIHVYEFKNTCTFLFYFISSDFVPCVSDVNPLLKLGDLEQVEDVVQDTGSSYLMCVCESWEKQSKELTVGMVVRAFFSPSNMKYLVSISCFCWCVYNKKA